VATKRLLEMNQKAFTTGLPRIPRAWSSLDFPSPTAPLFCVNVLAFSWLLELPVLPGPVQVPNVV